MARYWILAIAVGAFWGGIGLGSWMANYSRKDKTGLSLKECYRHYDKKFERR